MPRSKIKTDLIYAGKSGFCMSSVIANFTLTEYSYYKCEGGLHSGSQALWMHASLLSTNVRAHRWYWGCMKNDTSGSLKTMLSWLLCLIFSLDWCSLKQNYQRGKVSNWLHIDVEENKKETAFQTWVKSLFHRCGNLIINKWLKCFGTMV